MTFNINGKLDEGLLNAIGWRKEGPSHVDPTPPPPIPDPKPHPLCEKIMAEGFKINKETLSRVLFTIESTMNHQSSCLIHIYGPSGTGKTALCKLVLWALGYRQLELELDAWVNPTQGRNEVLDFLEEDSTLKAGLIINEVDGANHCTLQRVIKVYHNSSIVSHISSAYS